MNIKCISSLITALFLLACSTSSEQATEDAGGPPDAAAVDMANQDVPVAEETTLPADTAAVPDQVAQDLQEGETVCIPNCEGKECGSDGCDGSCGTCPCENCSFNAIECNEGLCVETPEMGCKEIFGCFDWECEAGDQACYQNCVNSATIEGQMAYNNLINCLDGFGYFDCAEEDQDCQEESFSQCTAEYYECFHGGMECVDMYLCVIDCPAGEGSQECATECFAEGTVEALMTWDGFLDCLDTHGYFDCGEADDACREAAWEACGDEFTACAHGDMSCADIYDCLGTCAPTDELCGLSCIIHGTIDAQGLWDDMVDCIMEQCGEDQTPECENTALQGTCAGVYNACIGG